MPTQPNEGKIVCPKCADCMDKIENNSHKCPSCDQVYTQDHIDSVRKSQSNLTKSASTPHPPTH